MPQDPQQPPPDYGDYPYGEQQPQPVQSNQANTQHPPEQQNPYGASQYPYGGEQENPYAASQYPYGGGEPVANPYEAPGVTSQVNYSYRDTVQESTPLPLGEAIRQLPQQYLRIVSKPSPTAFALEKGKASWDIVWVQLLGYAIIEAILGYLYILINPVQVPPALSRTVTPEMYQAFFAGLSIGRIFIVPISFFIGVGILHLIAKAFKGQGSFLQYSYCMLLFTLPLNILINLIQLIPVAGQIIFFLVGFLVGIYEIVLAIFATMAAHRLSGGKASAVILIPLGIVILLACVATFLLLFAFIRATGRIG